MLLLLLLWSLCGRCCSCRSCSRCLWITKSTIGSCDSSLLRVGSNDLNNFFFVLKSHVTWSPNGATATCKMRVTGPCTSQGYISHCYEAYVSKYRFLYEVFFWRFIHAFIVIHGVGISYSSFGSWIFPHYLGEFLDISLVYFAISLFCMQYLYSRYYIGPLIFCSLFVLYFIDENVLYNHQSDLLVNSAFTTSSTRDTIWFIARSISETTSYTFRVRSIIYRVTRAVACFARSIQVVGMCFGWFSIIGRNNKMM
jgi:hypothetical protein